MKCGCGIETPTPVFFAIQCGIGDIPPQGLWNCAKGSTHGIFWPDMTERQRKEATLAELTRQGGNEMACWPA